MYLQDQIGEAPKAPAERPGTPGTPGDAARPLAEQRRDELLRTCSGVEVLQRLDRFTPAERVAYWEGVLRRLPYVLRLKAELAKQVREGKMNSRQSAAIFNKVFAKLGYPPGYALGSEADEMARARCSLAQAQWRLCASLCFSRVPGLRLGAALAPPEGAGLGGLGCGGDCRCQPCRRARARRMTICRPGCGCWRCRTLTFRLGQTYEEEPPEPPSPAPGPPPPEHQPRPAGPSIRPPPTGSAGTMAGWFHEPPESSFPLPPPTLLPADAPRGRRFRSPPGPVQGPALRMPAYATIEGFGRDRWQLTPAQAHAVSGVARRIEASWRTTSPVTSLRFAAFMHAAETTPHLDSARARGVREALIAELGASSPGLLRRIRWEPDEPRGVTGHAPRVEIYAWLGVTSPPPATPAPRVPPPSEIRPPEFPRAPLPPFRPETVEERIRRVLLTLPPAPAPAGRRFSQQFWREVDTRLNATMQRVGIPASLRGPLRDGARAAIQRGTQAIFDQVLDAAGLTGEPHDAVSGTVRALMQVPVR